MKLNYLIITILLIFSNTAFSADYFWVGNSGNWSDLTHWSSVSGGAGSAYGVIPSTADNVFFDANSFNAAGQTIAVDVSADMATIDFTGVTNNPDFSGAITEAMNVAGNLIFTAGFTHSFLGNYTFSGTAVQSISSSGQVFNGDIMFDGVGGTWDLTDNVNVIGELGLQNGIFNSVNFDINAGSINTNRGTNLRTINFGSSNVTINDAGTSLDLRGNDVNLTVVSLPACLITFQHADDIRVEVGDEVKTIPAMTFANCAGTVHIETGAIEDLTKRITFGDIIVATDGCRFIAEGNNDDSNVKTYGNITLPNNCRYTLGNPDGTGGFGGNHTIINGEFIVGNDGDGQVRGNFIEFVQSFTAGNNSDCNFSHHTQVAGNLNVGNTNGNHIIFNRDLELTGDLNCGGSGTYRLDEDINIGGDINISNNSDVNFRSNGTAAIIDLSGTLSLGANAFADIGSGTVGLYTLNSVVLATQARLDVNSNSSITTIGDFTLSEFNIVQFNTNGATTVTGTLTSTGACDVWLWLKSLTNGVVADVSFTAPQSADFNICQDLNCTSANLTDNNGVDLSNNVGVTFATIIASNDFFWVGGTAGNTKTGTSSTGVNNDWSNPDNWSLTSGSYTGTNTCIPGAQDNVFFDLNSFTAGASTVDIDLFVQACNSMTWTNIPAGTTIDASLASTARELIIFGSLIFHNEVDNQFEGTVTFSAHDMTQREITSDGSNFFGNVNFDFIGGDWILLDDLTMTGGARADVTFVNGTVDADDKTWNIEDDWTVTNGTFTASTSTVVFNGPNSQNSYQDITSNANDFYNVLVNRQANGGASNRLVRLLDEITLGNNLDINLGGLIDNGFQITGAATGSMSISNNARLLLGRTGISTLFPTNYIRVNINLNERGQTRYHSSIAQTISNVPVYGRLYLTNANGGMKNKTIDGLVFVNDLLFIERDNNLVDNGFQITATSVSETVQMQVGSQMTLGTAISATEFPLVFTNFNLNHPSLIVYNSGLDQDVKSLTGGGNANYSNLTISDAAGSGSTVKTLLGDIIVRGDLTIDAGNNLDVDVTNNFGVELLGNWLNSGTFVEQNGSVQFTGTAAVQNLLSGGTPEDFFDFQVNNTSGNGVIIEDDVVIANTLTFTEGIIFEGAGGNEVVRFLNGASLPVIASDDSHVDGRVEKVTDLAAGGFTFPVGKNGIYRPIAMGVPTAINAEFRAEYFQVDPDPTYDHNSLAATLNHISSCEYWILDRIVPGADADITLSWNAATSCGVTNLSDLRVARWDGAIWQDEGNGATTGNTTSGTVVSTANVTNFSPFTLASISLGNPLPIELLEFDATLNSNNHVNLNWVTVSELNNDYFTIERSSDGIYFEDVVTVDGAGNSSIILNYESIDRYPFSGVSYYRLKQTDFDGNVSYSQIRQIEVDRGFAIYPNPTSVGNGFNVEVENNVKNLTVSIYSVTEQLVYSQFVDGTKVHINTSKYETGTYFVVVKNDSFTETKKLIIK